MPNWLALIHNDILQALAEIEIPDLIIPLGILCWIAILYIPLSGIHRDDEVTNFSYVFFFGALGVTFIAAIPKAFGVYPGTVSTIVGFSLFAGVSALRFRHNPVKVSKKSGGSNGRQKK
jgi:hypothetical protein